MRERSASILIVDDDLFCRTILSATLSEQGYSIEVAEDGKEGLEKLRKGAFDLVLLDLLMPEMDGFETLEWIKSENLSVPVIVISGEHDLDSVVGCIEMGAMDYLTKPFDPVLLRMRVANALLATRYSSRAGGEPGRVCVVDDDPVSRMLLMAALKGMGYEVEGADNARHAMAMLTGQQFDAVLLDLLMEDVDGFEMLRLIQADSRLGGIPVIVVSGEDDRSAVIRCIEMGAEDYLTKPFDGTLLRARVKRCVEQKRLKEQDVEARQELERLNRSLKVKSRFIRETFGRYLSDEVVETILESPEALALGGELREVTIMMSDLRGFTAIAERIGSDSVVRMLNIYLDVMTDSICKYDGTIIEFLGDAILAIFGAPVRHGDHAERAVACALEMQRAMEEVNDRMLRGRLPLLEMGIGLNTGDVIVGNIGSIRRAKYGVIGRNVNLTSRIESYSVGGQILAAESTLQACGGNVRTGQIFHVSPKGIRGQISIGEVYGTTGRYEVSMPERRWVYMDLHPPLAVAFTVVEGKHNASGTHRGKLFKVSSPENGICGEIHSGFDVPELTNIRIEFRPGGDASHIDEIYAKVTERIPDRPGEFKVRFTSVPPAAQNLLLAVSAGPDKTDVDYSGG
jgi:adenylate cyclase